MTDWLLPALAGFGTGILSAWGVGGGTLLLLLMTLFLGVDQTQAQGINLLEQGFKKLADVAALAMGAKASPIKPKTNPAK